MVSEIPWGDMRSVADSSPEPWEVVAEAEERHAKRDSLLGPLPPRALIGFTPTWGPEVAHYDPAIVICPGCREARLRPGEGCVICHATSNNSTRWPMQATVTKRVRSKKKTSKKSKEVT